MNGRSNLSLASCSSLMTDCHMARGEREEEGRRGREGEREGKKEGNNDLHKSITKIPIGRILCYICMCTCT